LLRFEIPHRGAPGSGQNSGDVGALNRNYSIRMSLHVRTRKRELRTSEIRTTHSGHLLNSDERLAQLIQRLQHLGHNIHDAAEDADDMGLRIECGRSGSSCWHVDSALYE
jgi:hypothetical protein